MMSRPNVSLSLGCSWLWLVLFAFLSPVSMHAQRQMEPLGRGVVAVRSATAQAYVGWRLLATDPETIAFNVYRSAGGGVGVKLNSQPLTNSTDFLDTTANFAVSNAWYVVPVLNGVEQAPNASWGLAANSPVRQYIPVPLQTPVNDGLDYDVKFGWVGDFDGDGEYDFLVDRLCTTANQRQYLQAYLRNGTLLWQVDMGPLSTNTANAYEPDAAAISVGDKDNVTVYDLDGDGKAEVIFRAANGTVLPGGVTIATNNSTSQFLCVLNGLTGAERARAVIPNLYFADGPLNCHAGVIYWDGIHPSILFDGENRVGGGAFQRQTVTWDFRNGQLTQRWMRGQIPGENDSEGHQLRIADVNHDGRDDLVQIGSVVSDSVTNGVMLYDTELLHGDRYHIADIDPERPGLEMYAIQQNNPTLLATALQDLASGTLFKKWYSAAVTDVGRGVTLDLNASQRGYEMFSTQPGIFNAKGGQIYVNNVWAPEAVWWDADLLREFEDGAGSGALSPVINKFNPATGVTDRLYTFYNEDGGCHQAYGGRAAFWGDILGDWREEVVVVANDFNSLRIYTTKIPATNRIYCLMQNPQYRVQCTYKGYYQASYVDYYLGADMPAIPIPPVSDARLVWRGGGANVWDTSTANWLTNNLWISNLVTVPFASGQTVLFDLSGSNQTAVTLNGSLTPGDVRVWSPKDYTFAGPGQLTGGMALTKAGAGKLIFSGTNIYTGRTLIGEGPFVVNGMLPNSPVTVRGGVWLDGRLSGTGVVGAAVRLDEGGGVSPGQGTNSAGTLTISNHLTLSGRTLSDFDLSNNPAGPANDLLVVTGNLTLTGTNKLVILPLAGPLPAGSVYPLINYSGSLNGSLANLAVSGLSGIPYTLTNPPGQIALVIKNHRAPTAITWTGGSGGNVWDLLTTSNFLNGTVRDQFAPGDTVRFDNVGASNLTVNLTGDLNCSGVIVDSTANYILAGGGAIIGGASLTKSNSGTLTISALNNTFTGRTLVAGGTLVVPELDAVGYPSPLGNPPGGATNLVLAGGALRITGESYTDRGMTLNAGTNTLEVLNAADQVTVAGAITGPGVLQKLGDGALALNVSNSYSGGTLIKAGSISLGGDTANQYGLGPGNVTLDNGTLRMFNDSGSYNHTYWNLIVPAGATGTLHADDRCYLHGTLTGGGTFNFHVNYVRTELDGNWSGFTGQINVNTAGSGDFRINNTAGYANAAVNLAAGIFAYHLGGAAVNLGALSGSAGSYLSGTPWTVGAKNTDATFAGSIAGNSITKVGSGTWTLTGSNYYTGATTVSAGTLIVNGNNGSASGAVSVAAGATLAGTGLIGGATTIQSGGKVSAGSNGIGTLAFNGNLTLNNGSTAVVEINRSTGTRDFVIVGGTLAYGGTLLVTNLAGALANEDSFKIFDASTYSGTFTTSNLPPLAAGLVWDTGALATNGVIRVVLAPATGPRDLTWKGDGVGNTWDVGGTANWLDTNNAAALFANGDSVLFNDLGSNNVPVMLTGALQPAAITVNVAKDYTFTGLGTLGGTGALFKAGTGSLTLTTPASYAGATIIHDGTLKLASSTAGLAHRWNFNGSLMDSVGGSPASLVDVGANNATLTASNVTLTGGTKAGSDYVSLGTNLLPASGAVTIEIWATPNAVQNWSRIFDFGASTTENLMMSWTRGTTLTQDRVEWADAGVVSTADDSNQPYTLGTEFHIAMVIEPGAGLLGATRVTWYRAASTNASLGAARGTFDTVNTPAGLVHTNCWLGRSQWPDNTASASYNEVRLWNRALSAAELQASHTLGPDGGTTGSLPATSAVNLTGVNATLELQSGQTQTIGSLAGVAGSEVKLTSDALNVGGNNTSTTFAGAFSGVCGLIKSGTGTLTLSGASTHSGPTTVGAGTLLVNGNLAGATGAVTVAVGATLGGGGMMGGDATVMEGGAVSPGAGIGTLTFNGDLTLAGTTFMEISCSPLTNDVIVKSGTLAYDGMLVVTNVGSAPAAAGDQFKLFSATGYAGAFVSHSLPTLPPGLVWNMSQLNVSGTLWVVSTNPPLLSLTNVGGGNFTFAGIGGTPGWDYYVLASTNLALPVGSWTRMTTNQFDAAGNCSFTVASDPQRPVQFFRLEVP